MAAGCLEVEIVSNISPSLRNAVRPYASKNDALALGVIAVDFLLYFSAAAFAVLADATWLKALCSLVAGTAIGSLFILGHDAAHGALVSHKRFNRVLARLLFLPSLHNYTLWRIAHNRTHHASSNVKGLNSFSPFTIAQFQKLPYWRRMVERIYRNPTGLGIYYAVERWWKHKLYPWATLNVVHRSSAMWDFVLVTSWFGIFCSVVLWLGAANDGTVALLSLFWGVLAPFVVWNYLMGLTVFLQHTHPEVKWFRTEEESHSDSNLGEAMVVVSTPRWYDIISHNTMHHPAHHVNPMIPWYRLRVAQARLSDVMGNSLIRERLGPKLVFDLTRRCQLYDYDTRGWLNFAGRPTAQPTMQASENRRGLTTGGKRPVRHAHFDVASAVNR